MAKVAFVSAMTPYLLKTDDNPEGVGKSTFEDIQANSAKDRFDFLQTFGKQLYGEGLLSKPISQGVLDWSFGMASLGSHEATVACGHAFAETDFRPDVASIKVPALVIHGEDDQTVPLKNSAERMSQYVPHATYVVYGGAPHGLFTTDKDKLNRDLIDFATTGQVQRSQDS